MEYLWKVEVRRVSDGMLITEATTPHEDVAERWFASGLHIRPGCGQMPDPICVKLSRIPMVSWEVVKQEQRTAAT